MTDSILSKLWTASEAFGKCAASVGGLLFVATPGVLVDDVVGGTVAGVACAAGSLMGDDVQAIEAARLEAVSKAAAENAAAELVKQQAAAKLAKEAADKLAKELAKQEAIRIAAEKAAKELAEKAAKELAEKAAKELAEKAAKELAEKAAKKLAEQLAKQTCSLNNFHVNGTKIVKEVLKGQTPAPVVDYSDVFSKPAVVAVDVCTPVEEVAAKAAELAEAQRLAQLAAEELAREEAARIAAELVEAQRVAAELAETQRLAVEAAKKTAEAAKKASEEAFAKLSYYDKSVAYFWSSHDFAMSYINPVKDAIGTTYSQYAEPVVTNIPYVGSTMNNAIKFVGNNNLASAFGAYKAYSAYRIMRSNLSVTQKVLAVAETALPFVARPIAEALVAATGTEYSAGVIQTGITLAPTAVRATVGLVQGTGRALTFAYNKCCGKAAVEKQAANDTATLELPKQEEQELLQIPTLENPEVTGGLKKSPSQENLLKAAQDLKSAVNTVVAVVKLQETAAVNNGRTFNGVSY